jgi:hypothetical protein
MNKALLFLFLVIAGTQVVFSQSPNKFNYQAIVRDSEGKLLVNEEISLRISILSNSATGNTVYSETQSATTNSNGLINLKIGEGNVINGSFNNIEWGNTLHYLKLEIDPEGGTNFTSMGTSQLVSVPYALYANSVNNADDADADPKNEIQDLSLDGNVLTITQNDNSTKIDLTPYMESPYWEENDTNIFYIGKRVGIGSNTSNSKLEVRADDNFTGSDTLFVVKDNQGQPVFAVFPGGVKVFINTTQKDKVGGFAISGRSVNKGIENDFMRVTPDSTRIYVNEPAKDKVGGFAISGRSANKLGLQKIMFANSDSTRIYIDDQSKDKVGGFAISGRSTNKGSSDYFNVSGSSAADTIDPSKPMVLWYPKREAFFTGRVLIEGPDSVGFNSVATGFESKSVGDYSHALGYKARAFGNNSTAIGNNANAIGQNSYSLGDSSRALGITSFAIGDHAVANGTGSYAIGSIGRDTANNEPTGQPTFAGGDFSFALGMGTKATNTSAFAMGNQTIASGAFSSASGLLTHAQGIFSTAMGFKTTAEGKASLAFGVQSKAIGNQSIALGGVPPYDDGFTVAKGVGSVSIGKETKALKAFSIAIGDSAVADSTFAMALGKSTEASGFASMSMGYFTDATGDFATSMGNQTVATGKYSVAMGHTTTAGGEASLAMGRASTASGNYSMAIGDNSSATGSGSFALGVNTSAENQGTFVAGLNSTASGIGSFAMGPYIDVSGNGSFAIALGTNNPLNPTVVEVTMDTVFAVLNGKMGVGTPNPTTRLHVNSGDILVTNGSFLDDGTPLSDFVFNKDYNLKTIEEHAEFMWREKHLPAVTGSKTIKQQKGYDISKRREQILEELEIAHIYIEQLNNKIKQLQSENEKLQKKVKEIDKIKKQLEEIQVQLYK